HDAIDARCAFEADHAFAELPGERDFGQRSEAVADRNDAQPRASDQRVARFADAGGDDDADMWIGERRIGLRQQADRYAARVADTLAHRFHDSLASAADDGKAHRADAASDRLGGVLLPDARFARTD